MMSESKIQIDRNALRTLKKILNLGVDGIGTLSGAKALGDRYLHNASFGSKLERVDALVKREGRKNFASGFLASLGGIVTLPITLPGSMAANWTLQTRMVAAMAHIGGFDIDDPPVRLSIMLCLLGKRGKETLNMDIEEFQKILRRDGLSRASNQSIHMLNQIVASQLMKMAAQKGFSRIGKVVPLFGGILGGTIDYLSGKDTAAFARELFQLDQQSASPD